MLSDRVDDRVYARGTATPGDLTLLLAAAVRSQKYVRSTTRTASSRGFMDPDGNKVKLWEPKLWDDKNKGA